MTDNELNALVAERVMGVRVDPDDCGCTDCILGETLNSRIVPDYCNDIAAAWGVLEYLCTQRSLWYTIEGGDRDGHEVAIEGAGHGECWCVKRISKLPRAICLAALAAVGVEVE